MIKVKELPDLIKHLEECNADPDGFVYIVTGKEMHDYVEGLDDLAHHNIAHDEGRQTRVWVMKHKEVL